MYVGYDDGAAKVLLAVPAEDGPFQELHALDPTTGRSTVLGTLSDADGTRLMGAGTLYRHVSGRVVAIGSTPEGDRRAITFRVSP